MKHLNRNAITPGVAILALCTPLLFSSSSSAAALTTSGPIFGLDSVLEPAAPTTQIASRVIQSSGAIEADVDAFRKLVGDPNNGVQPGQQPAGRREINWDAVPAAVTNVVNFPHRFFNAVSPRGLVYEAGARLLEVSDQRFADINPTYAADFTPFSGAKMFSPLDNTEVDVHFLVAGTNVEAGVRGFGIVFSDVDIAGQAGIELHAADGTLLDRLFAPVRSDARGASFVGVVYREPVIARVRIVSGNGLLSPTEKDITQGGTHDLVVMDDFIYGEPTATGN